MVLYLANPLRCLENIPPEWVFIFNQIFWFDSLLAVCKSSAWPDFPVCWPGEATQVCVQQDCLTGWRSYWSLQGLTPLNGIPIALGLLVQHTTSQLTAWILLPCVKGPTSGTYERFYQRYNWLSCSCLLFYWLFALIPTFECVSVSVTRADALKIYFWYNFH